MLALTVLKNEHINIDVPGLKEKIIVTVLSRSGRQFTVGLKAPKKVNIYRDDIIKGKKESQKESQADFKLTKE